MQKSPPVAVTMLGWRKDRVEVDNLSITSRADSRFCPESRGRWRKVRALLRPSFSLMRELQCLLWFGEGPSLGGGVGCCQPTGAGTEIMTLSRHN